MSNTAAKDLSLFVKYAEYDTLPEGDMIELGHPKCEANREFANWMVAQDSAAITVLDAYMEPLWHTAEDRFVGETFEFNKLPDAGDREYGFVWRDFIIVWYKNLGNGARCNRPINWKEMLQMIEEIAPAFTAWTIKHSRLQHERQDEHRANILRRAKGNQQ